MHASPTAIDEVEYAAAAHIPDPELPPLLNPPRPALSTHAIAEQDDIFPPQ